MNYLSDQTTVYISGPLQAFISFWSVLAFCPLLFCAVLPFFFLLWLFSCSWLLLCNSASPPAELHKCHHYSPASFLALPSHPTQLKEGSPLRGALYDTGCCSTSRDSTGKCLPVDSVNLACFQSQGGMFGWTTALPLPPATATEACVWVNHSHNFCTRLV